MKTVGTEGMVSGGMDSSILLWDLSSLKVRWQYQVEGRLPGIHSVMAVDAIDGKRLVAITREGCVALLDPASSRPLTSFVTLYSVPGTQCQVEQRGRESEPNTHINEREGQLHQTVGPPYVQFSAVAPCCDV